jgi:hypothetical protein
MPFFTEGNPTSSVKNGNRERIMTTFFETDIINSATPLETRFAGVHPRLYATADELEAARERCGREPWGGFLRRVRAQADQTVKAGTPPPGSGDDLRGYGCGLAHLAAVYRMTSEAGYLDAATALLLAMAEHEDWTCSLQFGHWGHGAAVAYDWLYDALAPAVRDAVRQALHDRAEVVFRALGNYRDAYPIGYAWNHSGVLLTGLTAAGCALWGEVDGPGRWLRMAGEKARLMAEALGADGASAEGLPYGQYHNDFLLKTLVLNEQLLGVDLLTESAFFRAYPYFLLYSTLPRSVWSHVSTFLNFGDGNGAHWQGPDIDLRLMARRFRDGHAQWLADAAVQANVCADSSCFLNLLWHDESVAPVPPDALPTLRHLTDKDIVIARSSWDDHAAVLAMKCGPNAGHHAAKHYRHDVSGGHMHPDAGHLLLHAGGDWLLIDDGYTQKWTAYQNTVLVNGIGQFGEGASWFEDLPFRQGWPEGRILRAEAGEALDCIIADAAPPYKPEAGLRRFLRHVLYLKPDVWVVVDELETAADATFQLRFHAPASFTAVDDATWAMQAEHATLRLSALGPTPCTGTPQRETLHGASVHANRDIDLLVIENAVPARQAVFVTVLHAHPNGAPPRVTARLERACDALRLRLDGTGATLRLQPGQADPAQAIYELEM